MSYVPKSAQRKIARANAMRTRTPGAVVQAVPAPLPRRLAYGTPGAGMYEVYFEGVRQHLCTVAETCDPATGVGFITRFVHGSGTTPLTRKTETLHGKVEIRRKGQKT